MSRCLTLASLLAATLAFAESPEPETEVATATKATVEKTLLQPLNAREVKRSRFSRSRQPAQARRVRVLDAVAQKDSQGKEFVAFAVDARHGWDDEELEGAKWRMATMTGCVYPDSGKVFVKRGEDHFESSVLLGKRTAAAAKNVCTGEAAQVAAKN